MRDPMTWSLPLGRLFGVTIRVHLLFPVMMLGLIGRVAYLDARPNLWIEATFLMLLLFFCVLLHEFGHVFGARWVEGDANEILLWPLGGLAYTDVPHTPRANLITALSGPLVNLVLCLGALLVLATFSYVPSFNPLADPYSPTLVNWKDGTPVGSKSGRGDLYKFIAYKEKDGDKPVPYNPNSDKPPDPQTVTAVVIPASEVDWPPWDEKLWNEGPLLHKDGSTRVKAERVENAVLLVQLARLFWLNWLLFLVNLVPAFPMDGGRVLQAILWWRTDYRYATLAAIFVSFIILFVVILLSIITWEPLIVGLAAFIYINGRREYIRLETGGEESVFGYDFSQGYTSLEREEPTPQPKKRQGWLKTWLQRRAQRKAQREQEQREAEERRMDELLEKVQRQGLPSLTDEERRFLTRVSAKYRNRQ